MKNNYDVANNKTKPFCYYLTNKEKLQKSCKTIIENFRQCASNRNGNMLDVYRQ